MTGLPFLKPDDKPECTTAPHLFYSDNKEEQALARSMCDDCPFRTPCAEWGVKHEKHGVWGSTMPDQRDAWRKLWNITLDLPQAKLNLCSRGLHAMTLENRLPWALDSSRCRTCYDEYIRRNYKSRAGVKKKRAAVA